MSLITRGRYRIHKAGVPSTEVLVVVDEDDPVPDDTPPLRAIFLNADGTVPHESDYFPLEVLTVDRWERLGD